MRRALIRFLRNTWVPLGIAATLVAVMLVGLPWYYGVRGQLPERGLSAPELEWAAAYAPWRTRVGETLVRAYDNRTSLDGELGRILDEIAGCGTELVRRTGIPPTERLQPVVDLAVSACAAADAALAEYRLEGDIPTASTSANLAAASSALAEAEFRLRLLLLAQRPLARLGGRVHESRIEPRLGRALSAAQPTDVVCWSEEEWTQVRAELAALGQEEDPRLRGDVNAYRFRVHASPRLCGVVVRFAYPAGTPHAALASAEVAEALTALLHAAQHAVAGVVDEAEAECEAVPRVAGAAVRLGADGDAAARLAGLARDASRCP